MFLVLTVFLCLNNAAPSEWLRNSAAKLQHADTMQESTHSVLEETEKYKLSPERISEFWSRVEIKGASECWPWKRGVDRDGYGRFEAFGCSRAAHQIALLIHTGKHWGKLSTLHSCDSPICCNPAHLSLGTTGRNNQERAERGRSATGSRSGAHIYYGSELTDDIVREIRNLYSSGELNQPKLAKKFGVHQTCISSIVLNKTWKHVT